MAASYVRNKDQKLNPAEFKAPLPKTKPGRGGRDGQADVPARVSHNGSQQHETDMFGTDAGSFDDTATDLTEHAANTPEPQYAQEPSSDLYGDLITSDGVEEDEDQQDDVLWYIKGGEERSVSKLADRILYDLVYQDLAKSASARKKAPPVDPSSYPPTTSGNPSVASPEEQQPAQDPRVLTQNAPPSPFSQPMRSAQQAWIPQQTTAALKPHDGYQPGIHAPPPTYGIGHPRLNLPVQPKRQPSKQKLTANRVRSSRSPEKMAMNQRTVNVFGQMPGLPSSKHVERSMVTPPKDDTHAHETGQEANSERDTDSPHGLSEPVEVEPPEPQLDYDEAELMKKDFAQLQAEKYDLDPRKVPAGIQELHDEALDAAVVTHLTGSAQQQKDFFATLDIDQWEQAGDWFQTQFADMFQKFKVIRREKRKLSREFEATIAERHGMVVQKKTLTEDALAAMKGAGTSVLDTPRKLKQKR